MYILLYICVLLLYMCMLQQRNVVTTETILYIAFNWSLSVCAFFFKIRMFWLLFQNKVCFVCWNLTDGLNFQNNFCSVPEKSSFIQISTRWMVLFTFVINHLSWHFLKTSSQVLIIYQLLQIQSVLKSITMYHFQMTVYQFQPKNPIPKLIQIPY